MSAWLSRKSSIQQWSREYRMDRTQKITVSCPTAQFQHYQQDILTAIRRVCESGDYILGPEVKSFEQAFATYNQSNYCAGVASGTDALILAMRALNIRSGDEVITVAHTALATVAAIVATGATPVLIDIESDYFTLDPNVIEPAITKKTKAIIPVHLYGQPCDMHPIMAIATQYKLHVIEDCAQAHGAQYHHQNVGTFGNIGCFSFYPTKNLGGIGDGGAIITNDEDLYKKINKLRQYGWNEHRIADCSSTVSRLDELQAAILRIKLNDLDKSNQKRRYIAATYQAHINTPEIVKPLNRPDTTHVYHLYVIKTNHQEQLQHKLKHQGIDTGIHYKKAVHQHPAYAALVRIPQPLSITENLVSKIVSLPIYPELNLKKVVDISKYITTSLHKATYNVS